MLSLLSLWLILLAIGIIDAWLFTYAGVSTFFGIAVHGTLMALLGANNWALQRDLDSRNRPMDDLLRIEQMQVELILNLNASNTMLERQNRILAFKVKSLQQRPPKSKSFDTFLKDDRSI